MRSKGAERLCTTLKKMGYKMAVISGGFLPVAREVQRHLGLDYAFANNLEVDEHTGLLTGQVRGTAATETYRFFASIALFKFLFKF